MSGKVATKEQTSNLPVTDDYLDKYAGEGTHVAGEHTITPTAKILQGQSPQVKKNNIAYVVGAQPGMIFLSNSAEPLISGDEGILFQPCWFSTPWEIRTSKEQTGMANYVDTVPEPLPVWIAKRSDKGNYVYYDTPEGNVAYQIHEHAGIIHRGALRLPYAIKFAGTGIFVSKNFNGLISSQRTSSNKPAPRFAYRYMMKVRSQTNSAGEWGQWAITSDSKVTLEDLELGHQLRKAFEERRTSVEREATEHFSQDTGDEAM